MMVKILDGLVVRKKIAARLKRKISRWPRPPKLVIVQVGKRQESNTYIAQKKLFGETIGAAIEHRRLPATVSTAAVLGELRRLNADRTVAGIIVQLPLPAKLDRYQIIEAIAPVKDVDGLTSANLGRLWQGREDGLRPATARAVLTLLDYYRLPIAGQRAVVIGRSSLVGKPTALILLLQNATVTLVHRQTKNLAEICHEADILVSAAGQPGLVTASFVKPGATVVDVGLTVKAGKLFGDVVFDEVKNIAGALSPVPGGVGPLTVACLFENLLRAAQNQNA